MKAQEIIIITGLSGSGKSSAAEAFEDSGYYCVDNMPVALLPVFLEMPVINSSQIQGFVFVMDLREIDFLIKFPEIFDVLKQKDYLLNIIFLEADETILLQRYSQTRRHHPLSKEKSLVDAIQTEKHQLAALKKAAHIVIDTSHLNVHELKSRITAIAQKSVTLHKMQISVISFGFKYGLPQNVDLLMDVRFLKNPFFVPELKLKDGRSEDVKNYVINNGETITFLKKYLELLDYLIPLYKNEGKSYLTIGIGCTGGRHRSVAISEAIYTHIRSLHQKVSIKHRDITRDIV